MPRYRADVADTIAELEAEIGRLPSTARRILAARLFVRWTQPDLAKWYGCDQKTIWNFERGKREPPADLVEWLETMAAWLRDNPPPAWHGKPGRPARQPA
jgi:hypothetical protein